MSLTVAQVRQQVAARIALISGYREMSSPYERVGADPSSRLHQGFAVSVQTSELNAGRGVPTDGVLAVTTARILLAWRCPPKEQIAAYDALLDGEQALIKQIVARSSSPVWPGEMQPEWVRSERTVDEEGEWFTSTIEFSIRHVLAYQ